MERSQGLWWLQQLVAYQPCTLQQDKATKTVWITIASWLVHSILTTQRKGDNISPQHLATSTLSRRCKTHKNGVASSSKYENKVCIKIAFPRWKLKASAHVFDSRLQRYYTSWSFWQQESINLNWAFLHDCTSVVGSHVLNVWEWLSPFLCRFVWVAMLILSMNSGDTAIICISHDVTTITICSDCVNCTTEKDNFKRALFSQSVLI